MCNRSYKRGDVSIIIISSCAIIMECSSTESCEPFLWLVNEDNGNVSSEPGRYLACLEFITPDGFKKWVYVRKNWHEHHDWDVKEFEKVNIYAPGAIPVLQTDKRNKCLKVEVTQSGYQFVESIDLKEVDAFNLYTSLWVDRYVDRNSTWKGNFIAPQCDGVNSCETSTGEDEDVVG